jgi:hypothetical protein
MGRRTRGPRMAWFSGYRVSYKTWCEWTVTLPRYELPPGYRLYPHIFDSVNRGERYYFLSYVQWKDNLPLKYRRKMPRPRCESVFLFALLALRLTFAKTKKLKSILFLSPFSFQFDGLNSAARIKLYRANRITTRRFPKTSRVIESNSSTS